MIKRIFLILVILGGYLFYCPGIALAQDGGVNMKVRVLERKMTDTINDFVWDGQAPLKAVLGASTDIASSAADKPPRNLFQIRWRNLLFLLSVYDIYYLISMI